MVCVQSTLLLSITAKNVRIQSDVRLIDLKKCTVQLWEKELYMKKTSQGKMNPDLGFERRVSGEEG